MGQAWELTRLAMAQSGHPSQVVQEGEREEEANYQINLHAHSDVTSGIGCAAALLRVSQTMI